MAGSELCPWSERREKTEVVYAVIVTSVTLLATAGHYVRAYLGVQHSSLALTYLLCVYVCPSFPLLQLAFGLLVAMVLFLLNETVQLRQEDEDGHQESLLTTTRDYKIILCYVFNPNLVFTQRGMGAINVLTLSVKRKQRRLTSRHLGGYIIICFGLLQALGSLIKQLRRVFHPYVHPCSHDRSKPEECRRYVGPDWQFDKAGLYFGYHDLATIGADTTIMSSAFGICTLLCSTLVHKLLGLRWVSRDVPYQSRLLIGQLVLILLTTLITITLTQSKLVTATYGLPAQAFAIFKVEYLVFIGGLIMVAWFAMVGFLTIAINSKHEDPLADDSPPLTRRTMTTSFAIGMSAAIILFIWTFFVEYPRAVFESIQLAYASRRGEPWPVNLPCPQLWKDPVWIPAL